MKPIVTFLTLAAVVIISEGNPLFWQGIQHRIAGGNIAKPHQIPYQARLELRVMTWYGQIRNTTCGGSLISDRVVITAAHCLESGRSGTVYLGTTNIKADESSRIVMKVTKRNFVVHGRFSSTNYVNDIAMIILPKRVTFSEAVQPISLPQSSYMEVENRTGVISGFGITESGATSSQLRFVNRTILPEIRCKREFPREFKNDKHVCVDGSGGKSACQGDSGGPLVVEEANGSKVLVGVTSFGRPNCGGGGSPVVYTRVSMFLDWIHKYINIEF